MNLAVWEDRGGSCEFSLESSPYWVWPYRISSTHRWPIVVASALRGGRHVRHGVYNIVVKNSSSTAKLTGFQAHLSRFLTWASYFSVLSTQCFHL